MSEQVLSASGVQKYYGAKLILDDVNFNLNRGERAVLVGENGVGKSTLARLILGIESVERGTIRRAPGSIVAYLPQELQVGDLFTVEEYISESLGELTSLQRRLRALESQMAKGEDIAAALEEYGHLQTLFDLRGGYTLDARRKQVFTGLDLDHIDVSRSVMSLSGGEKTRIGLAVLLLQAPDLLILDEPTNHLDFAGLDWLEGYLLTYPHALLMITHDRRFINNLASKILDLSAVTHNLTTYHGNYDDYLAAREAQYRREVDAYHGQVNRMKELRAQMKKEAHGHRKAKRPDDGDKWIKFTAQQQVARTVSKSVRSARQELETLEANRLDNPRHVWHIEYEFDPLPLHSMEPVQLNSLSIAFSDRTIISGADAILRKGDRVALAAPNGFGKTTLLRLITGELDATGGTVKVMPSVKLGYLDQTGESFDDSRNVVDLLSDISTDNADSILTLLHRSGLFRDAHLAAKSVAELSLGQRRKLGIACLIHSRANVLLLDEPTNHLDLMSLEALERALLSFPGAILAATHDRWFVDRIATVVWRLHDGKLFVD
ncbi:MAG: ABC-F family ATP-binding cassette domain-containing protein [Chloroflexi bacterium]|nr:ABC-F family ATP-binding cassette domain-containing protein [Chloroflexota bacterium]